MLLLALLSTSEPKKIKKQHPVSVVTVTKAKFTVFDSQGLHRVWMLIGIVTDLNCGSEMMRMKEAAAFGGFRWFLLSYRRVWERTSCNERNTRLPVPGECVADRGDFLLASYAVTRPLMRRTASSRGEKRNISGRGCDATKAPHQCSC